VTPLVSVVIPAFNAGRFLGDAIESVLAQTLDEWELFVVDDGSEDGTLAVARSYAERDDRICALPLGENRGIAVARNTGLAASTKDTRFVIFHDADDVWEPDALEQLAAAAQREADAVGAHGLVRVIDAGGSPMKMEHRGNIRHRVEGGRFVPLSAEEPSTFASLVICVPWPPGVVLWRREAFEEAGAWDARLPTQETNMYMRLSRLGPVAFVNRVVVNYREHQSQVTKTSVFDEQYASSVRSMESWCENDGERALARVARHHVEHYLFPRWVARDRVRWARAKAARGNLWGAAQELRRATTSYALSLRYWRRYRGAG
jgi:glycosyltransferase involved in cell wall biosynthesis